MPYSIFTYLKNVFQARIEQLILQTETQYNSFKIADDEQKKYHLKLFRPNLENPANKDATTELNNREIKRSDDIKDVSCIWLDLTLFAAYWRHSNRPNWYWTKL